MGQVAGQLAPSSVADPLDGALANALGGGGPQADGHADDLLSELAGAEIDRMLAAADVEPSVAPPVAPAVVRPVIATEVATPAPFAPPEPPALPKAESPPAPLAQVEPAPAVAPVVAADLGAVLAEAAAPRPATRSAAPASDLNLGEVVDRLPLVVRLLALLNAPLDVLPATVRDLIGKVAVVTTVNSVAVITYVVIFRRHG